MSKEIRIDKRLTLIIKWQPCKVGRTSVAASIDLEEGSGHLEINHYFPDFTSRS